MLNLCVNWEHALLINSCSIEIVLVETVLVTNCTTLVYLVNLKVACGCTGHG